ncbi:MAG: hypothetical protein RL648_144 [Verrucomicrobiota bacterium]|jgi:predicted neuraminidase
MKNRIHIHSRLLAKMMTFVALVLMVKAYGAPTVVTEFIYTEAPYPSCHASTLVEIRPGLLGAAWFGGTHERHPDVGIWFARKVDGDWEEPVEVANGVQADGTRFPTWNPVLFQSPDGPLFLFYKVGPNPREWWGMQIKSTDGGANWSTPERLPDGILGPIKNKPVVLGDGSWLSGSSVESLSTGWQVHFERSADGGQTWSKTEPVGKGVGFDAIQPSILIHDERTLQVLCRTKQGTVGMSWSYDAGLTWTEISATELPNPNSGTDAVTLQDGRHLLVYNHSAHWPERSGKGSRYPLNVAISEDGLNWEMVHVLETEPMDAGYAYPAVIQATNGTIHISYTWDRKRIKHVALDPTKL